MDIQLAPGESYLDADFCFVGPAQVGDTVYCDLDYDGVQDPGEAGIGGVRGDRQPRDVGGPAEGVDPHVDPGALQRRSEVLHVHPGPSVDLMGPLPGQQSDTQRIFSRVNVHDGTVVRKSPGVEKRS